MSALIDSNVLIAGVLEDHPGHAAALQFLTGNGGYSTATHALSELYNTLTKPRFYEWSPERAAGAVIEFERQLTVVGLDTTQHVRAIAAFAASGGIGANVYGYLIGAAARQAGLKCIVTFNLKHFAPLFPDLTILTPAQYLETL